ncbi:monocarboxylate transporter 13-like [Saccoglossus kowalevskii]
MQRKVKHYHGDRQEEGGWGWLVVLHCHVMFLLIVGLTGSFGVLVVRLVEYFDEDVGDVSWIPSLSTAVQLFISPVAGALSKRHGTRPVVVAGALISSIGWIMSTFATSVLFLCISFGFLTGIGYGLAYVPSVAMIGEYFERRHALANSIAYVGSGIGLIALPPFLQVVMDTYGWRGTFFIAGAINLNMIASSVLLRPLNRKLDDKDTSTVCNSGGPGKQGNYFTLYLNKIEKYIDFSLFYNNGLFTLMAVAMTLNAFGYYTMTVHFIPNAVYLGIPKLRAAFLQTVIGIFSLIGRLTHGCFVGSIDLLKPARVYLGSTAVCGIACLLTPTADNYVTLALCAALIGLSSGMFMPLISVVMKDFVGIEQLSHALGLSFLLMGVGDCMGPPIAGLLYDATNSYTLSFTIAGAALLASSCLLLFEIPVRNRRDSIYQKVSLSSSVTEGERLSGWDTVSVNIIYFKDDMVSRGPVTEL